MCFSCCNCHLNKMTFRSSEKASTLHAVIKAIFVENGLMSDTVRHWDPGWVKPSSLSSKTSAVYGVVYTNNHNTVW